MRKLIVLLFLFLSLVINAGQDTVTKTAPSIDDPIELVSSCEEFLKYGEFKADDRIWIKQTLLDPVFYPAIERYADSYSLSIDTLVSCIETMATSESGNYKGQPFMSYLFKKYNNPFGIKGSAVNANTVEYYDGVRTEIIDGFKSFSSLTDAIDYLVGAFLMTPRYERVREATTAKEFFKALRLCGYFTHPSWDSVYLYPTYCTYYR